MRVPNPAAAAATPPTTPATFAFPDGATLWLWAHVQANAPVGTVDTFLNTNLAQNPDAAFSRLFSPRRLSPATAYRAFLLPTYEAGRLAGLGLEVPTAVGNNYAWQGHTHAYLDLPIYHQWEFRTGPAGDFESLARLLRPADADSFATLPLDVTTPLGSAGTGTRVRRTVEMAGILKPAGPVQAVPAAITRDLYDQLAPGFAPPQSQPGRRPVVAPPIYGRYFAPPTLDPLTSSGEIATPDWRHQVNLDPRYRAAASIGAQVIQEKQEEYVQRAWEQVRDILEANANLRGMQSGLETTSALRNQHLPVVGTGTGSLTNGLAARTAAGTTTSTATTSGTTLENYGLHLTGLAFTRVRMPGGGATIQEAIRQSNMPLAAFSPTFRRIAKPFGRYQTVMAGPPLRPTQQPQAADPQTLRERGTSLRQRDSLLTLLQQGLIAAAPVKEGIIRAHQFSNEVVSEIIRETPSSFWTVDEHGTYQEFNEGTYYQNFANAWETFSQIDFTGEDTPRPDLDLEEVKQAIIAGTQPEPVFLARANRALRSVPHYGAYSAAAPAGGAQFRAVAGTARPEPQLSAIKQVMAYPVFKDAMGEVLRSKYPNLFLPGVEDFPANTITLLEPHQELIEAYMLGLNHAMGSELLWRGFPTDARGSYFRQFWDPSEFLNMTTTSHLSPEALAAKEEQHRDVLPLDLWNGNALGDNEVPLPVPAGRLLLAIRAEVLQRFPNTVVCAQPAIRPAGGGELEPDASKPYEYPVQRLTVGEDIAVFNFAMSEGKATGTGPGADPLAPEGYFFILMERPGEPLFGLDDDQGADIQQQPTTWNALAWQHLGTQPGANLGIVPGTRPTALGDTVVPNIQTSAHLAYALFQQPVMVAVHASELM
ncbi:hypothetical protein GCM10023185_36690 [Hymenobacter saemangeumensis]|uniref:Uncharacterized protein n=1 Tax=Hymenobacter saemangeumensis TaxID=1084522 RepID=A0ABP8IQ11_9BACT